MEIQFPHEFVYETAETADIADVIASLLGAEQLIRETAPLLQGCLQGVSIQKINVSVRSISQESPLRETLFVAMFLVYQKDLEHGVSVLSEQIIGSPIPAEFKTIATIAFCLLLYHGADFIFSQVNKNSFSKKIRAQSESLATELADECGISKERVQTILEKQYGKSRLRTIAQSALSFVAPSKRHNNVPILIGGRRIDSDIIKEIPSESQIESADVPDIARPHNNVLIDLHAQDVDRTKSGWAAVIPEISPRRLKMEIYPPIRPEDLYTKTRIRGDVMLISNKKTDGSYQPTTFHLINIRDET